VLHVLTWPSQIADRLAAVAPICTRKLVKRGSSRIRVQDRRELPEEAGASDSRARPVRQPVEIHVCLGPLARDRAKTGQEMVRAREVPSSSASSMNFWSRGGLEKLVGFPPGQIAGRFQHFIEEGSRILD